MHRYTLHFELSTADASGAPVCIAGNFNIWNENEYKMKEIGKGAYELELDLEWKNEHPIEFKFIRTRWANVEVDEYGSYVPNRIIEDPQEKIVAWVPRWRSQGEVCDKDLMPLIEFHSLRLPRARKDRRVSVLLPYDYHQTSKSYPVLYLMDGQNLFEDSAPFGSWDINTKLAILAEKQMHEVITVCIDHAGMKRIEEYVFPSHKNEKGKGSEFVNWIIKTLIPFINKKYRTHTDANNTGIGGSSLGGLISLMAGVTHPQSFGKLMLLSPSLWKIMDLIYDRMMYLPLISNNQYIYLYGGKKEASNMTGFLTDFYNQLLQIDPANDRVHLNINESGEHSEKYWGKEFPFALKYLFY